MEFDLSWNSDTQSLLDDDKTAIDISFPRPTLGP